MKNNKGQILIGGIIMIAITAIVGVILLLSSAQNIHPTVNTVDLVNYSVALGALYTETSIPGIGVVGDVVMHNVTSGVVIGAANYTVTDYELVDSTLTATLNVTSATIASQTVNLSYTYQPEGYSTNSGARAVANLIIILFALSIAVVTLTPTLKSKILESIGK